MMKWIVPAAAVVALGAGGAWWMTRSDAPAAAPELPGGAASAQTVDVADLPEVAEITLGDPDAPVQIVEYASFTCPHCANFHAGPFQQIKSDFIETGLVHYTIREVFFDRYGLWAAMVARCDGPERFHGIVEMIYATQREWLSGDSDADVANNLRRIGRQAGMSTDEVNACLEDRDKALALTATFQANAEADDIRATPTFMINGEQFSNMPFEEFEQLINDRIDG